MFIILMAILLSNYLGNDIANLVGNIAYIPVSGAFVTISTILTLRRRKTTLNKFLFCLALSSALWFVAEMSWIILKLIYNENPFPSAADLIYTSGYIPISVSLFLLAKPNLKKISIDVKIIATIISLAVLIPLILLASNHQHENLVLQTISFGYPVFDAVLLWFTVICVMSFAKKKNGSLTFIIAAICCLIIGDTAFAASIMDETYYVGKPLEIFWLWSYALFTYSIITLRKQSDKFEAVLQGNVEVRQLKITPKYKTLLSFAAISVLFVIVFSSLGYFKFTHFSTNEELVIRPALYAGLVLTVGCIIFGIVLNRKSEKFSPLLRDVKHGNDQLQVIQHQIDRLEARSKRNSRIILIGISAVFLVFLSYITISMDSTTGATQLTSSYIIENLKGDRINTYVAWKVPEDKTLQVSLINTASISDEKIQSMVNAIMSESTISLPNKFMNKDPPDLSSTYYRGWKGALESVKQKTTFPIPTSFDISNSDRSIGDIVIILSTQNDADGTFGFTRLIIDDHNNQILKAYITIFNVKNLDNDELSSVVRHEFGHAIGLMHSTDKSDLMFPTFRTGSAFISECDLDAVISLYNDEKITDVICRQ